MIKGSFLALNVLLALTIYFLFSGWTGWRMSAQELEQRTDVIEASTVYRENKEDEQITYIELAEDEQTRVRDKQIMYFSKSHVYYGDLKPVSKVKEYTEQAEVYHRVGTLFIILGTLTGIGSWLAYHESKKVRGFYGNLATVETQLVSFSRVES